LKTLFWDTSALLGLIFQEPFSPSALKAWDQADANYGWRWLAVEAFAALSRRRADAGQWRTLDKLLSALHFADLEPSEMAALCRTNREWRLRAADAGHLYVFSRLAEVFPGIELVCCDEEMIASGCHMGYSLWSEAGEKNALKEPSATYVGRRRVQKRKTPRRNP
jgi:predicted nucleic acid-binding protein